MFTPHPVRRGQIMYLGQVLKLAHGRLRARYAEFVLKLPRCSDPHAKLVHLDLLLFKVVQRVRAARIRPHVREGDLLRCALLQEQFPVRWTEDKCRECAMEQSFVDVLHQMACVFVTQRYISGNFCRTCPRELNRSSCPSRQWRCLAHRPVYSARP